MAETAPSGLHIAGLTWSLDGASMLPAHEVAQEQGPPLTRVHELPPAYDPFLVERPSAVDTTISASCRPLPAIDQAQPAIFDTHLLWSLHPWQGKRAFLFRSTTPRGLPWRVALADEEGGEWQIITADQLPFAVPDGAYPHPLAFPMAQLIMVDQLTRRQGLLLHSCGVADGDRGLVFCGRSGAGKSTIARLWLRSAAVLNDDRIIVRREQGRWWIYGTPWPGDSAQAEAGRAPLTRLFFLERQERPSVTPLSSDQVHRRLLSCTWLPLWDRQRLDATLQLLAQLAQEVGGCDLAFQPEPSAVDTIRHAL